jgi:hypothetical protein
MTKQPTRKPDKPRSAVLSKWGGAITAGANGFQLVPNVLLRKQKQLGLNATDVLVILNVTMHWWELDELPYPRPSAIAARMNLSPRTVERSMRKLEKLGLLVRMKRESGDGPGVRRFDPSGLVDRLEELVALSETKRARQIQQEARVSGWDL